MATTISKPLESLLRGELIGVKASIALVFISLALAAYLRLNIPPYRGLPLYGRDKDAWTNLQAEMFWFLHAKRVIDEGLKKFKGPFQVIANGEPLIILPPAIMNEVKDDDRMTFKAWLQKLFFTTYPGFEGFIPAVQNDVFTTSVRTGITQTLGKIPDILSEETELILNELFPVSDEWQETLFDQEALKIIARLSSRVFIPALCHNEEWLKVAVEYTVDFFTAAYVLRMFPPITRPVVHWFLPQTRKLRSDLAIARRLIEPVVAERKKEQAEALKEGRKPEKHIDAVQWIQDTVTLKGQPCDPVHGQLNYTLGAVHTTTVTLLNALYDLMSNGLIEPVREEVEAVLKEEGGYTKNALNQLKLMDSIMRESGRMHPPTMLPMNRVAEVSLTLPDGSVVPKGATCGIPTARQWDPVAYKNPEEFNGYRFFDMRQIAGNESKFQFVSTGDDYIPFGHGKHACPGRFFASNEIKIIIAQLLMKYDLKFVGGATKRPPPKQMGSDLMTDPDMKILFRKRTPAMKV